MSYQNEVVWRKALAAKGRDWVARELKTRPGLPNDPLLDVVFEEPLPSREFCQNWIAEDANRLFTFSPAIIVGLVLVVIVVASATMGVRSFKTSLIQQHHQSFTGR
jgi:hypothetical protein